jgi:putative peptidoglycan lipid II flippase
MGEPEPPASGRRHAATVAGGIFLSRLAGFLRDRAIAHHLGVGPHADVLRAALRGPNILQNLLGEGTISAAFIPIYSRLLAAGRPHDAGRFAGAVFGILLAIAAALALLGFALARPIVAALSPGFLADAAAVARGTLGVDRFPLAVAAVRIVFPMTGLLVLSAWALGVLNSHRRFFLPYVAPVLWNAAIIAAIIAAASGWTVPGAAGAAAGAGLEGLLLAACWGGLAGGLLQFAVQLPLVARLLTGFRPSLGRRVEGVGEAARAFGPVVAARGVAQLSAWLDLFLASLLAVGALGALGWAQTLYVLPVSLFGMSVAAAELPELSRRGGPGVPDGFAARLQEALRRIAFLTVPTCVGYLAFGFLIVGAVYRTGAFRAADNWLVYLALAGYTLGLPATTRSRLLQNAFYALSDTRTPARIAVARVAVSTAVAVPLMLALDRVPIGAVAGGAVEGGASGSALFLGAVGLALGSAVGAWLEVWRLDARLRGRLPGFATPRAAMARLGLVAVAACVPAGGVWILLPPLHVAATALCVVGLFGAAYLGLALAFGFPEAAAWLGRLRR